MAHTGPNLSEGILLWRVHMEHDALTYGGTYDFQTNWLFGSIHPAWEYLQLSPRTLNHMATLRHGETWRNMAIEFHHFP